MKSLPSGLKKLPRLPLANLPTPLQEMKNLTRELGGPRLLVKRDDLTGLATGGNKTRKLEFLIADALQQGADCVITAGGPQSNHCRQTAAAAAIAGLGCHLVLGGDQPARSEGNLLLDRLLGATIHWTPKPQRNQTMSDLTEKLRGGGHQPYIIPVGGSNALGAVGYVLAMFELVDQLDAQNCQVDCIVTPASSGGTQAGTVLGAKLAGFTGRTLAVSIDQTPDDKFPEELCKIANAASQLLQVDFRLTPDDFELVYDYLGDGYGVVGNLERDAIHLAAREEGLLVGPVYSGRAMGALIDLIRRQHFPTDQTILFWHTGDESALHAYADDLQ